jgi:hypothetical protein
MDGAAGAWHLRRASFLHSDSVYGVFATVLGLLAWIYLGVEITVYAAEINVVVARRLWPRSIVQRPLTQDDRAVLAAQVLQNQRRDDQHVEVSYDDRPAEAAASSTTPRTPDQVAPPAQSRPGGVSDWTALERLTKHAGRRAGSSGPGSARRARPLPCRDELPTGLRGSVPAPGGLRATSQPGHAGAAGERLGLDGHIQAAGVKGIVAGRG